MLLGAQPPLEEPSSMPREEIPVSPPGESLRFLESPIPLEKQRFLKYGNFPHVLWEISGEVEME
jgi:hypothetical protein